MVCGCGLRWALRCGFCGRRRAWPRLWRRAEGIVVQPGDSLSEIAERARVPVEESDGAERD